MVDVDCTKEMDNLLKIYKTGLDDAKERMDDNMHTTMWYLKRMVESYDQYQDYNHKYQCLKEKLHGE